MDTNQRPPRYHAYMLRMWEERSEDHSKSAQWRFQMEDPHSGRRHGFNDLSALTAYLHEVVAHDGDAGLSPAQPDQ